MMTNHDYKRTYTLVDISRKIGRPRTTLKDWAELFREFLPTIGTGRTMRYKEEAIEIFGIISKMKDSNEPNDYIRDHLRGIAREITIMADEDGDKPFLMSMVERYESLEREVQELKSAMGSLTTILEQAIGREVQKEVAASSEQMYERIDNVSSELKKQSVELSMQLSSQHEKLETISSTLSRVESYRKKTFWSRIFGK